MRDNLRRSGFKFTGYCSYTNVAANNQDWVNCVCCYFNGYSNSIFDQAGQTYCKKGDEKGAEDP
jgi:hypothetical protein